MRPTHCMTAGLICSSTVSLLVTHLQLTGSPAAVSATLLAQVLLWAAALGRSLSAVARQRGRGPSPEAVRQTLLTALPGDEQEVLRRLLNGLRVYVPRWARRRPQPLAIDLHQQPYYGAKGTPGVVGGQAKAGAKYFWTYATAAVLVDGLRLTVGLVPVRPGQTLAASVQALLAQVQAAGVRIRWLALDRGFYAADVVQELQGRGVAFVMPMLRRGKADRGTQPFFAPARPSGWATYTWTARPRRWDASRQKKVKTAAVTVTVDVCVRARPGRGPLVYIAHGLTWAPDLLAKRYRRRFGIESSYRQLRACQAVTTSRDARVRLLLVGLGLWLRQSWVWLHREVLAEQGRGRPKLHRERLRLEDVKLWVHTHLAEELGLRLQLEIAEPFPNLLSGAR